MNIFVLDDEMGELLRKIFDKLSMQVLMENPKLIETFASLNFVKDMK